MGMEQAWLLPAIPIGSFVFLLALRNVLPRQGDWVSIGAIGASFVLFFFVLTDLTGALVPGKPFPGVDKGFTWLEFGTFQLRFGFFVDEIAVVMLAVVSFVALMVQVYSLGYMKGEAHYGWYYTAMSLFAASMLTLVLADNLLLLYIAWELVGFCSYLLIGFWWERRSAAEAAKKAFVTTRIGDVGLLIGIILLFRETGTFQISTILEMARAGELDPTFVTAAALLIFAGAMGKSAQFPLHVWLPDAMEGPTPVSALIHAATMVVAGVYLVARMLPLFEVGPGANEFVLGIAVLTTLMSATMGLAATDLKRIIAYSTINSLGLMFIALASFGPGAAMLYLFAHGFFKALLFLAAGSVLHATGRAEVTEMGGLARKMPLTAAVFGLGVLAMAGLFPLSGFWAKDEVLLATLEHQHVGVFLLVFVSVVITALYMTRAYVLTFMGEPRDHEAYQHAHEAPPSMAVPLVVLAVLTLVSGFVVFDAVGRAMGFPGGFLQFVFFEEPEVLNVSAALAAASALAVAFGVLLGLYIWSPRARRAQQLAALFPEAYALFKNKYYMDDIYQTLINRFVLGVARVVGWFDRAVVNDTGVNGTALLAWFAGDRLRYQQTGRLPNYALLIGAGVTVLALVAFVVTI